MNRADSFKVAAVILAAVAFVFSLVTVYVRSNYDGMTPEVYCQLAYFIEYFDYYVEDGISYVVYEIAAFLVSLIPSLLLAIICLAQKRNSPVVFLMPLVVTAAWQAIAIAWLAADGYSLNGAITQSAVVAVALLAFTCCLAAKGNAGTAAIAVASVLSAAALVMMFSCTIPFGYHYYDPSYTSDSYYISTLIGSAALWFGVAFGMMSVTQQQTTKISQANTAAASAQVAAATVAPRSFASAADELKGYKELLDMGAITQDEFDDKKKQLLGL